MANRQKEKVRKKKNHKILKCLCAIAALMIILYLALVNFLVSAALVPSFMRKLESFERITNESYEAQVHTSDIKVNRQLVLNEVNEWLEIAEGQKISAKTEDGYTLIAKEFFADNDSHKWVLLLHGYTGWKEEMYPFAYWYHEQNYHVIVPDLRCQGESEGDFIGMGWTDHYDCERWINYILSCDPDSQIVIHGQSMGAATSLMMTGEEKLSDHIKAVVSDCAYTDAYSMFGEKIKDWFHLPAFPLVDSACVMLRLRGGYNLKDASAINAVRKSSTPTLFIHGDADALISVQMTKDLYEAANCQKELLIVEGAGHAQAQDKDPGTYYGTVEAFLDNYINE
ncbi:MAG: alpha/beta hydrolase [Lachnospiraceae bacterium]|nr:alpha/beta hydrolase [Lachnospiraceae bacterium]